MSQPGHACRWEVVASWPSGPGGETDHLAACPGCGSTTIRSDNELEEGEE